MRLTSALGPTTELAIAPARVGLGLTADLTALAPECNGVGIFALGHGLALHRGHKFVSPEKLRRVDEQARRQRFGKHTARMGFKHAVDLSGLFGESEAVTDGQATESLGGRDVFHAPKIPYRLGYVNKYSRVAP